MSEVPLGSFLSGGIDSSLVVHYANRALKEPLSTFAIGVHEEGQISATCLAHGSSLWPSSCTPIAKVDKGSLSARLA